MQEGNSSIARAVLCALCVALGAGSARSEDIYPSGPVTIVVPQSAGSQADLLVRVLAEQLGKSLHQPFIVSNRDGAAGTIGVAAVKQAKSDGYTLGYGSQGPFTVQPNLRRAMPYDVNDFEFICQSNTITLVVAVGPKSPFKSLPELIEAARKSPGTITLGSVGIGSGPHLVGESIAIEAGVKFNHIPFRSIGDLNTQLIAGTIDFTVTTPTLVTVQKGNVRPLAVTGNTKLSTHPEVPLLKDLGYKRGSLPGFIGLYAAKGTPAAAITRLRQACPAAVNSEAFKTASEMTASTVQYADSVPYTQNVKQDLRSMADLVHALGIKPE